MAPSRAAHYRTATRTPSAESGSPVLPEPRLATLWAAATYAVATIALAWPALVGRFLAGPHSDQYIAGYAFREFAAQSLRSGQGFPQWNPYLFGGMPYVAAMHGDIFYPTFLLRLVLPTDIAMTWGFIIHVFLAGFFTFLFLRAYGLSFIPSLVGGLAYLLSGPIAAYVSPGHDGKLFVSALLPLTLWMLTLAIRRGRATAWGLLALTVGLAVLSPHPQLLQYLLLTSGAFALFLAFGADESGAKLERPVALRRLGLALAAVVVGGLVGAVQYLPVMDYVAWSPRAGGKGWEHAVSYSMPLEETINFYLPQFSGILDRYWGRNGIHLHSEYLGAAVLVLAGAALGRLNDARGRAFRWFWVGVAVVALLWTLGGFTPFYRLVYAVIPGTKFFRAPSTFMYVLAFAVAVLAALGSDRILRRQVGTRYAIGWIVFGLAMLLLAASGALYNVALNVIAGFGEGPFAERARLRLVEGRGDVTLGALRALLFTGAMAGLIIAHARGAFRATVVAWGLVALVAMDLWSVERRYWIFSPPAREVYASDPIISHLAQHAADGRVLVLAQTAEGLAPRDPYFGTDGEGRGTGLMVHGIRSVSGYHGNALGRYEELIYARTAEGPISASPGFWRHANARYLYTNSPIAGGQLKQLLGPVRNSAGSTAYLYELPGPHRAAWLVPSVVKAPDSTIAAAVIDPRFDPSRLVAVSDTSPIDAASQVNPREPIAVDPVVRRPTADRIDAEWTTGAPAGSFLVVSENYYPGWRALVDGRPGRVIRANYNLMAVPLATGARRVALEFHDDAYHTGKHVTLAALALILGGTIVGVRADRKARRG